MSDVNWEGEKNEMRLCPTCRSPISVWATRCKFCGDEVGRPKREEKQLTVHDLGGEKENSSYRVSGNVTDALEAFRAETVSAREEARRQEEERQSSWFRRHAEEQAVHARDPALPELEGFHRELSMSSSTPPVQRRTKPRSRVPGISRTLFLGAAIVAGLVILWMGTSFAWARISDYLDGPADINAIPDVNRAMQMLEAGRPVLEALQEANRAVMQYDTHENREIQENVRMAFVERVNELLEIDPWDRDNFSAASQLVARALAFDRSSTIRDLEQAVRRETAAYKMVLRDLSTEGTPTATFLLNNAVQEEEVAREGEYVQDRFLVQDINERRVVLLDERHQVPGGFRRLISYPLQPLMPG